MLPDVVLTFWLHSRRIAAATWLIAGSLLLASCASTQEAAGIAQTGATAPPSDAGTVPASVASAPKDPPRRFVDLERGQARVALASAASASVAGPLSPRTHAGPPLVVQTRAGDAAVEYDLVRVLWGTNRNAVPVRAGAESAMPQFGSGRADKLSVGMALVTVPKVARRPGSIPRPREYTLLSLGYRQSEDPSKHFTIGALETLDEAQVLGVMQAMARDSTSFAGHAFVYVHGYANSFTDGVYRAAQLAYDMGFDGVPLMYSFPSSGSLSGYLYDRDSVDASVVHFRAFLAMVGRSAPLRQVHILAHSMGARLVVDALFPAGGGPVGRTPKLGQVILAAPDIDSSVMRSRVAAVRRLQHAATLYASNSDEALITSRRIAGSQPRAGDVVDGRPFIAEGVETIDISSMSTLVFWGRNHSKYAESTHVLQDIALLMRHGTRPPDVRFPVYRPIRTADGSYWAYIRN